MLIPIRTDRPPKRRPVVTDGLIVVNLIVYLIGAAGAYFGLFDQVAMASFGHYDPQHFKVWQLITYQFLHDPYGIWHIAFNMLFLKVFGSAVEDRIGRAGFLGFYLVGGCVAAIAHGKMSLAPVIGASGAIAGVTGAFLALFPRSRVLTLVFVFGFFAIPSLWLIGFFIAIDFLRQAFEMLGRGGSNVAYAAHLAGYFYGFGMGFSLLALKMIKREEFDVFFLFTQARRRAAFRAASRQGAAGAWDSAQADTGQRLAKQNARARPLTEPQRKHLAERAEIARLLEAHDLPQAAAKYRLLLADSPDAVLDEARQLDIANQLAAEGANSDGARAYELFLERYSSSPKASEVRLMLALIYARRMPKPARARELLEKARPNLHNEAHAALADQLLAELGASG